MPYFSPDTWWHIFYAAILAVIAFRREQKGMRQAIDNFTNLLREYPLHRHINGSISYPAGMEPGEIERLRV